MKRHASRTLALGLLLALGLAGCGGNGNGDTVSVDDFRFQPSALEVSTGTTVTWRNDDAVGHTATAGTPEAPEETFDLDLPEEGATGSHTFAEAGTFTYFCRVHESMTGEVTVTE